MEEKQQVRKSHYEEFGVESCAPDDDFAYWVTMKRREKESERRERFTSKKAEG
jgi:hypothetical protein